ncbi:hypothetical protein C7Y69_09170 [Alteromonas sp. KS69]|mgnify:CR=1 FL=1|uniref:transporter substrate-binding domain-containing protein n=1 Tax=Alteromonas sp. KS69 TaxID=2109917 RepID=UPI000F886421|nr:transporter substrate-binding domain-containing protein [Alteromonas sp. KS69]RUP81310.1 hypothetical protein C7Y69_09170 [Alteromonas sp. KS69]|tara:strand:- start:273 stop:1163 length:891 start_codon:yes stop_codon:yes gene_type:complete
MRLSALVLVVLQFVASTHVKAEFNDVTLTQAFADDNYGLYQQKVLEAVFSATPEYGEIQISLHPQPMSQSRQVVTLLKGDAHVMWSVTNAEREKLLTPIKFPLLKGLAGYRVLVIAKNAQHNFQQTLTTDELKTRTLVQGNDWPDLHVLKSNGFNAEGEEWSLWFTSMYTMVEKGIVDGFPRNVTEANRDLIRHADKAVTIDKNHLFIYPNYEYFFVHPDNSALAKRIRVGLSRLIENGTLEALFNQFESHKLALTLADDPHRARHLLQNHSLPYVLDYARWDLEKAKAIKALLSE